MSIYHQPALRSRRDPVTLYLVFLAIGLIATLFTLR